MSSVYRREVRAYFSSPLAYAVMFSFWLVGGYFFAAGLLSSREAIMDPFFGNTSILLIFLAPVLTMRLWAEEEQSGTAELLRTVPLPTWKIVLGKYLAVLTVFAAMLVGTLVYPLFLELHAAPAWGVVLSGYLGFFLLGAATLAVGTFTSTLSDSQMVAGVIGGGLLLLLWAAEWVAGDLPGLLGNVVAYASLLTHFNDFVSGVIDLRHIVYEVTFAAGFLALAVVGVERRGWQ